MKVLITGANGLLGQKLILQLLEEEFEIVATGRGQNRNPKDDYVYESLDITNKDAVRAVVKNHKPDAIVNAAAMTHVDQCELNPEECWEQNVTAVQHLVEACSQYGSFLLHISTDFIFDGSAGPYKEDDPPSPQSHYARSKLESEKLLTSSSIDWAIARTMLVYGVAHDMSRSNIILWVKDNLEKGKEINVVNDQWRMPTLAEDLAAGCILILKKKATGVYNISGSDMLSPYDMAIETANFFGLDSSLINEVDGTVFTQPAKRPARTGFVLDKARKVLGYQPRSFQAGLQLLKDQLSLRP